jgi:hypothetical protein
MTDCCTYKCEQGRNCPVRAARAEQGKPLSRGENVYVYTIMAVGLAAYTAVIVYIFWGTS